MAAGGDDRISNLPDSIIHHILSFIDTTSAVRTSVLSKQWKSAWKHVHALNMELKFDEYSSPDDDGLDVRLRVSGLELERLSLLYIDEWKLEIFAPKLKSFKLASLGDMEFSELTLPSLVHADIESGREYGSGEDYDIQKADLVSMFSGLYNVEYLTLCKEISEAVRRQSKFLEQQSCPFTKLKKLNMEFDSSHDIPYKVLNHYFLNGCSNASLNIQSLEKGSWSIMSERLP
ncbi:Putative F-box/LRR-repeat protein At3g28410 [Linum grandiflorum]